MNTMNEQELKARVEAKQKHLEARLAEIKADSAQAGSEAKKQVETKLQQISDATSEGWDNLSESATEKLNSILRD